MTCESACFDTFSVHEFIALYLIIVFIILPAMTAYSPAMLALHDMLKAQMEMTKEFLSSQKQLYQDFTRNIKPTFKYTTLEDTKKVDMTSYINKIATYYTALHTTYVFIHLKIRDHQRDVVSQNCPTFPFYKLRGK